MKYILLIATLFFASIGKGQTTVTSNLTLTALPALTAGDSLFVNNIVKLEKPIAYTATKTYQFTVLVMTFADRTLIYTLTEDFVEDIIEFAEGKIIVYPREFD
jgi:hypothetical protein